MSKRSKGKKRYQSKYQDYIYWPKRKNYIPGYNYVGPYTDATQRALPTNAIDAAAADHDMQYAIIQASGQNPYTTWNEADQWMQRKLDKMTLRQKFRAPLMYPAAQGFLKGKKRFMKHEQQLTKAARQMQPKGSHVASKRKMPYGRRRGYKRRQPPRRRGRRMRKRMLPKKRRKVNRAATYASEKKRLEKFGVKVSPPNKHVDYSSFAVEQTTLNQSHIDLHTVGDLTKVNAYFKQYVKQQNAAGTAFEVVEMHHDTDSNLSNLNYAMLYNETAHYNFRNNWKCVITIEAWWCKPKIDTNQTCQGAWSIGLDELYTSGSANTYEVQPFLHYPSQSKMFRDTYTIVKKKKYKLEPGTELKLTLSTGWKYVNEDYFDYHTAEYPKKTNCQLMLRMTGSIAHNADANNHYTGYSTFQLDAIAYCNIQYAPCATTNVKKWSNSGSFTLTDPVLTNKAGNIDDEDPILV